MGRLKWGCHNEGMLSDCRKNSLTLHPSIYHPSANSAILIMSFHQRDEFTFVTLFKTGKFLDDRKKIESNIPQLILPRGLQRISTNRTLFPSIFHGSICTSLRG